MVSARHVFGLAMVASLIAACSSDDGKPSGSSGTTVPPPTDAGSEAAADAGSAKKKNAELCKAPEECESNICFVGGTQSYCTVKCTPADAATLCAAPLTGSCNRQGYCKRD